jgi:hypothetical protein
VEALRQAPAGDDGGFLKGLKPLGKSLRADTDERAFQGAKAIDAGREVSQYEESPLAGDDVGGPENWAGLRVRTCFLHDAGTPAGLSSVVSKR